MSTPKVQYGYADGSNNTIRPTTVTYPNGRVLTYDYGTPGGINDAASRVEKIVDDDDTVLAQYEYLGLGTAVTVDYVEPEVKYTLVGTAGGNDPDTGDIYRGLDRFGRVKDCQWYDYGSLVDAARIQYGYDRASNRTWRQDPVAQSYSKGFDELYGYDRLHRLKEMQRGTLNGPKTAITSGTFAECWSLDPTGNWNGYRRDEDGTSAWDLIQSRTANPVNEIGSITNAIGPAWTQPGYDPAGNMTAIPQPKDPTKPYEATYDAWNRLMKIADGDNTVSEYSYDGAKRRIIQRSYTSGVLSDTRHLYYSRPRQWQVIETRVNTSTNAERQFVWGVRYIDDCILRDRDTNASDTLDERLYVYQDANWNVTTISSSTTGAVQERYAYTAYGTPLSLTPTFGSRAASSCDWETLYCGYWHEMTTGLFHIRNRAFHPTIGIWLQRDPIGYSDGMSLTAAYFTIDSTDPWGLQQIAPGVPDNWDWFDWDPEIQTQDFIWHYFTGGGEHLHIPSGDLVKLMNDSFFMESFNFDTVVSGMLDSSGLSCDGPRTKFVSATFKTNPYTYGGDVGNTAWSIATDDFHVYGNTTIYVSYTGTMSISCGCDPEQVTSMTFDGTINYMLKDRFANPLDKGGAFNEGPDTEVPLGKPYGFSGSYKTKQMSIAADIPCDPQPCANNPERPGRGERVRNERRDGRQRRD